MILPFPFGDRRLSAVHPLLLYHRKGGR